MRLKMVRHGFRRGRLPPGANAAMEGLADGAPGTKACAVEEKEDGMLAGDKIVATTVDSSILEAA